MRSPARSANNGRPRAEAWLRVDTARAVIASTEPRIALHLAGNGVTLAIGPIPAACLPLLPAPPDARRRPRNGD